MKEQKLLNLPEADGDQSSHTGQPEPGLHSWEVQRFQNFWLFSLTSIPLAFEKIIRQVIEFTPQSKVKKKERRAMKNLVAINNPADVTIIVGYFVIVLGVGIWVSESQ